MMRQGNFGSKCKALLVLHKTLCFNQKINIEDTLFPNLEVLILQKVLHLEQYKDTDFKYHYS